MIAKKREKGVYLCTPDRRQSKTLLKIDECGSKIDRNSVFDCHLSPVERQMAMKNPVSNDFDLHLLIVLTFSIAAYPVCYGKKPTLCAMYQYNKP